MYIEMLSRSAKKNTQGELFQMSLDGVVGMTDIKVCAIAVMGIDIMTY